MRARNGCGGRFDTCSDDQRSGTLGESSKLEMAPLFIFVAVLLAGSLGILIAFVPNWSGGCWPDGGFCRLYPDLSNSIDEAKDTVSPEQQSTDETRTQHLLLTVR